MAGGGWGEVGGGGGEGGEAGLVTDSDKMFLLLTFSLQPRHPLHILSLDEPSGWSGIETV